MTRPDVPVGIVGAGPVGLATALLLSSYGVRSVILEAEPALLKQGSRACTIQGDVLEVLERIGCAETLTAEGIHWNVGRTYVRGEVLTTTVYPDRLGFPPFVNVSQYRTQQVMLERLNEGSLAEIRWEHRVTGVAQDDEAVTVQAATPYGPSELRVAYLVAADGIHSPLRHLTGVEWTGYSHGDRFLSVDLRAVLPLAHERHFHYDHPANPGRQVVMHAQPDDVWRIDWQLPVDTDVEAEQRSDRFDARVRATLGDVPYEIDWLSTYRFNQRVVERFKLGRIFFAGDAAHALPPYGARGMNSGIQDADNLAWKLALVVTGRSDESLLDSYHEERHAAARENLRVTEATIKFMVPPGRVNRWVRNTLLRLAPGLEFLRPHVNAGRMAEPFVYAESPIVERRGGADRLVGSFAPDGMVAFDGGQVRLRERLGEVFVGLYFDDDPERAARFAKRALAASGAVPVAVYLVKDAGPELRAAYGVEGPAWFVVRPDGHIAAAGEGDDGEAFAATVIRCSRGRPRVETKTTTDVRTLAIEAGAPRR
jgi:3-(3-hydroxy-phenyl)propionate hydroxylase